MSSLAHVTGDVRLRLRPGGFDLLGVRSPHSMVRPDAKYGEESALWSARDAAGFARIYGLPSKLAQPSEEQE